MASCGVLPSSSASDETLAYGVRDGDDGAFEVLYQRYWEPLRRYAARLLRDAAEGEDAAQVALANAYRALRSGQTPHAVRPWLYAIARNAAWGLRSERAETVELTPEVAACDDALAGEGAALVAAVAQLPERQRLVFAWRELRGATNRETAQALGLRESQVEQLLFAGRARLAELLLFGDSVSCESVRAVGTTELSRPERRALKRHVHHCPECTALVGGRLRLGARLLAPAEALRRLLELGLAASAPVKAGAVTAIAVAVSAPVVIPAVDKPAAQPHRQHAVAPRVRPEPVAPLPVPVPHPTPTKAAPQPSHVEPRPTATVTPKPPPPHATSVPAVTTAPAPPEPPRAVVRAAPTLTAPTTPPARPKERQQPVVDRAPAPAPAETTPTRAERTTTAPEPPPTTTAETVTASDAPLARQRADDLTESR
jgi:RNA polymerase sigma factor (sigma-70 family)